jgi:micrococcal nuclease
VTRLLAVVLALVLARAAVAQTPDQDIRAEVQRYVSAINGGDPAAVAALYLKDTSTSSAGDGQVYRGWERIARLLRDVYAQAGSIRMTTDSIRVSWLGSDAAIAVFPYQWRVGERETVAGVMTLVYRRTAQGWGVAHDHTSTLQGPGASVGAADTAEASGPSTPRRATTACKVLRITDGDGIVCDRIGRVRLIGIDTPELDQRPHGPRAASALASLVQVGTDVKLEPDVEARDRYGRLLAYVWVGNAMINWRMVRDGWAVLLTYPPNVQYVEAFAQAERRAREEGRGLWGTDGFACLPRDHRARRC